MMKTSTAITRMDQNGKNGRNRKLPRPPDKEAPAAAENQQPPDQGRKALGVVARCIRIVRHGCARPAGITLIARCLLRYTAHGNSPFLVPAARRRPMAVTDWHGQDPCGGHGGHRPVQGDPVCTAMPGSAPGNSAAERDPVRPGWSDDKEVVRPGESGGRYVCELLVSLPVRSA
jgi:hypothetical protein